MSHVVAMDNQTIYKTLVNIRSGFHTVYKVHNDTLDEPINYQNRTLSISKGDKMVWTNDVERHADVKILTIISQEELWDDYSGVLHSISKEFNYTFNESGIYEVYLEENDELKQEIIVEPLEPHHDKFETNSVTGYPFVSTTSQMVMNQLMINISGNGGDNFDIKCWNGSNKSTTINNLVLVIDSSGSTMSGDNIIGMTYSKLIRKAALDIIDNMKYYNNVEIGVISFGKHIRKTKLLPMNDDGIRDLKNFINDTVPWPGSLESNPTRLHSGLSTADYLLMSTNGIKKMIVISDGLIRPERFAESLTKATDIKNKGVDIAYIQVFLTYEKSRKPYRFYGHLANNSSDIDVVMLNHDDDINDLLYINIEKPVIEDICSIKNGSEILIRITSEKGILVDDVTIKIDEKDVGKISYGMLYYTPTIGTHNITAIKTGYKDAKKTIEMSPSQTSVIIPTETVITIPSGTKNLNFTASTPIPIQTIDNAIPGFTIILGIMTILLMYRFGKNKE